MAASEGDVQQFTQRAVEVVRECAHVPSLTSAHVVELGGGRYEVLTKWSQRELERGKKVAFSRSFFVERKGEQVEGVVSSTYQSDATNQLKVSHAPQSGIQAVLVKEKPANAKLSDEAQQYIEVWGRQGLVKTVGVSDLKKHGKIHEDVHFGSFHLSASCRKLLYIAEREKPKTISFFKKTPGKSEDDKAPVQGGEHVFEEHWGEQLSSVVDPVPVVMSVDSEECAVVEVGDVSAGQAQWVPGGGEGEEGAGEEEIVYVGSENKPRKLGFVYCLNRPSAIYHAHLDSGKITALTDKTHCVFSPRFSPQGDKLVYFESVAPGPHHSCFALKMINWASKTVTTVVDVVARPDVGMFPGFYSVSLPERCWDVAGKRILCSESWGSLLKVVQVDVESGSVRCVSEEEKEKGAWSVMCVSHDLVVAQHASPSRTPRLVVGVVPPDMSHNITWTELSPSPVSTLTEGVSWEVLSFQPDPDTVPYEAILLKPRPSPSSALPPLAVFPHGGPHGVYVASFMVWPVCLAALGFAVLLVNFRGSTGFGQDGVFHLPGKVGRCDVDDVQRAAEEVVKRGGVDGGKVCVLGGSHGGFLTVHLVGQFPEFYKAACVRNPVVDIAVCTCNIHHSDQSRSSLEKILHEEFYKAACALNPVVDIAGMRVPTDIPDWTYEVCGVPFDPATPPKLEDVSKQLQHSPIIHAHKIKAPVLVLLGADDRRVPPSQGRSLYHLLRAMGKETKLHLYPGECHPLSSVFCDADCFVNAAQWLHRHGCSTACSA